MRKQLALGLAVALCAMSASVQAGEEQGAEKPQMFSIYKEIVKPGMTEQYEAAVKHMISEFHAYQIDPEKVHWMAVSGPEIGYLYVAPIENWAAIDRQHGYWMEVLETIGMDKWEEMMAPGEEAIERVEVFHVAKRADLSYVPENPRLKDEEIEYIHYGFYYVIPGKQKEIEAIAQEFAELYKSKGIDTGWSIYESVTGSDLPVIVVAQGARSAADFHSNRERLHELLGEDAKKIGMKLGATVRRMEFKEGTPRPDLSYPAPDLHEKAESHEGHEGHNH
ncbi:MAG: hypothetical protein ACYTGF_04645 [Planctomycetota bacterium]|jgi:hypothetical protein